MCYYGNTCYYGSITFGGKYQSVKQKHINQMMVIISIRMQKWRFAFMLLIQELFI